MDFDGITPGAQGTAEQPKARAKRSRKRSVTIFIVISLLNVGLLALLWTQLITPAHTSQIPASGSTSNGAISGNYNSPLLGKPAPDFTLPLLNGQGGPIHLASFKGKPVMLNFWASWCGPCNQEAPFLAKVAPQLKAQGVVLLGVDSQDTSGPALKFIQKYGITYPNVQDTLTGTTTTNYGISTLPVSVFINRAGVVAATWIIPLDKKGLQQELAKITR